MNRTRTKTQYLLGCIPVWKTIQKTQREDTENAVGVMEWTSQKAER